MIKFSAFLTESLDVDKLKHLEHAEDHIIHGGNEGLSHAIGNLNDLHQFLTGAKPTSKFTTKYDGSPSVVFGVNPENKKFFVASKSAFNKNPKINYTPEDIQANHGHAPGLVQKLNQALQHLPKIMPKDKNDEMSGVYQGDFLYDKNDVEDEDGKYKFTPNTITYSADKNAPQGKKINDSQIGFVVHTKYEGKDLPSMKAGFDVDHSQFKQHPDVNLVNPEINDKSKTQYTKSQQDKYQQHIIDAADAYSKMDPEFLNKLSDHDEMLKRYINQTVRDSSTPNSIDYSSFIEDKRNKELSKLKTQAAKDKKADTFNKLISDIKDDRDNFDKSFNLHHHLQKAKDVLVTSLGNPTDFEHSVGGKTVKPEGFVSIRDGRPTKLVDRAEFSRLNFANNRGAGEPDTSTSEDLGVKKPHVFAFGRMNPPTVGHGALVDKVHELAAANKSGHSIVLSSSQDPEKNPLSPDQKLKHAKRFFPNTNISVASKDSPSFIDQADNLHKQGVDHLIMVAGSDRTDEYKQLLDKYNGKGPNKRFNFKRIDVVSAGQRDPDAEGVEGMSASKMRSHAMDRNFNQFSKGIPRHVDPEHAKEMYNDVRKGMDINIDQNTSGISLSRYAKRNDEIGMKARNEIERRKVIKNSKAAIKEDNVMTSSGGEIRGLGLVSGNPSGSLTTYAAMNATDADTRDQILRGLIKFSHYDYHGSIDLNKKDKNKLITKK